MHTIKPLDTLLIEKMAKCGAIVQRSQCDWWIRWVCSRIFVFNFHLRVGVQIDLENLVRYECDLMEISRLLSLLLRQSDNV